MSFSRRQAAPPIYAVPPTAQEALLAALSIPQDDPKIDEYAAILREHQAWSVTKLASSSAPQAWALLERLATVKVCPPRTYALCPVTDRPKGETPALRPKRQRTVRSDPRRIAHVVPNPKVRGSACYERFFLYAVGDTLDEAVAKGVTRADIRYDVKRGFVKLEGQ